MRGLVLFLLLIIVVSLLSFLTWSINNDKRQFEESGKLEFKTFTSAVCKESDKFVQCKDVLFVECNGKISNANDVEECNGFKLNHKKVTGFAVFEKDWKDPRN